MNKPNLFQVKMFFSYILGVSGVCCILVGFCYLFIVLGSALEQVEKDIKAAGLVGLSGMVGSLIVLGVLPQEKEEPSEDEDEDDTTDESLVTVLEKSFYTESYMQSLLKEKEEYQRLYNLTLDELNKRKKTQD